MDAAKPSDAQLVAASVAGQRDAFRLIVERYQTLICSIAYNATGNLSRSEDVAQETFIAAWSRLATLREPDKLRGWLCGIARHRIGRQLRDQRHEPVHGAAPLEAAHDAPAPETQPSAYAVRRDEEAILWRALEKIPERYREPLILFYREHQSVGAVARSLDLSEDAVKQRLSRGRRLLEEEMRAFVEDTLRRTAPARPFSLAVLSMLPPAGSLLGTSGGAAGAKGAMGGAKGAGAVATKSGVWSALLAPLAPFLGIAAGVAAQGLIIRELTADPALRFRRIAQMVAGWILYIGAAAGGEAATHALANRFGWNDRVRFTAVVGYWAFFVAVTLALQILVIRRMKARRGRELSGEGVAAPLAPLKPWMLAQVVVGMHLAMFSWLAALAWRAGDGPGLTCIAAAFATLCLGSFLTLRRGTREPLVVIRGVVRHTAWGAGLALVMVNLRAGVWVAAGYGVTVAEAHRIVPLWIIPAFSAALVLWPVFLFALIRSGTSARGAAPGK